MAQRLAITFRAVFKQLAFAWILRHAYVGIFSLLMLGIVGLPVPDELLLTFAGYLVYRGELLPIPTLMSAFLGSLCGITLSYTLGRTLGTHLLHRYGRPLHITAEKVELTHQWFRRIGKWSLTFGYFVPGIRHLTAYVAGSAKLETPVFMLYAYSGGVFWSLVFLSLGYFGGDAWMRLTQMLHRGLLVISLVGAAVVAVYWLVKEKKRVGEEPGARS